MRHSAATSHAAAPRVRSNARAFTLVELLVVLGILILVMSLLMPGLKKARDAARRVACLSNLRQLGIAMTSYARDNDDYFPFHAGVDEPQPWPAEDWIWWQIKSAHRDITKSPVAKYLGPNFYNTLLRCPSDDVSIRPRPIDEIYPYSYTMNMLVSSNNPYIGAPPQHQPRVTTIKRPAEMILVVEEDFRSVDDGNWHPELVGTSIENFVSTVHDDNRKDAGGRGNVLLCDGHAEFVTRKYSQDQRHYDPTLN